MKFKISNVKKIWDKTRGKIHNRSGSVKKCVEELQKIIPDKFVIDHIDKIEAGKVELSITKPLTKEEKDKISKVIAKHNKTDVTMKTYNRTVVEETFGVLEANS